jgi:hypothetical protein
LLGDEKSGWPLLSVRERSSPVEEAGTNSILVNVVSYISDVSCHGEPKSHSLLINPRNLDIYYNYLLNTGKRRS